MKRRFREAEKLWKRAIEINPRNDEALVELGSLYADMEDMDSAVLYWEKTLKIDAQNDIAFSNLGDFYIERGLYSKAEQVYRAAVKKNPMKDGNGASRRNSLKII